MCAGNKGSKEGSCKGDSGGPLMIFNTAETLFTQVGVVAGGINSDQCGNFDLPTVYTRLDHPEILGFIEQHVYN